MASEEVCLLGAGLIAAGTVHTLTCKVTSGHTTAAPTTLLSDKAATRCECYWCYWCADT